QKERCGSFGMHSSVAPNRTRPSLSVLPVLPCVLCVALLIWRPAEAAGIPQPVARALAQAHVPEDAVGIVVEPVEGDAPLVAHRAREAMAPASVMKLFTSFAALEILGPAFTFRTDFLATGPVETGGVLAGDLVIRGG